MLTPTLVLLGTALMSGPRVGTAAREASASFAAVAGLGPIAVPHPSDSALFVPWTSVSVALSVAAFALWRHILPTSIVRAIDTATWPLLSLVPRVHTGIVGDYVAWIGVGLALLTGAFTLG